MGDHDDKKHGDNGPADTQFLDLEVTRVIYSRADELAQEVGRDLLRDSLRKAIRARIGDEIDEIAEIVAESFVEDFQTNLSIEQAIDARRKDRKDVEARIRERLGQLGQSTAAKKKPASPGKKASRKASKKKTASRKRR